MGVAPFEPRWYGYLKKITLSDLTDSQRYLLRGFGKRQLLRFEMTSRHKTLIVISHYDLRPKIILQELVNSLSGCECDIVVVVNNDDLNSLRYDIFCPGVTCINRPNSGMNIGAWGCAFHEFPGYEYYIFLQDECIVKDYLFIDAYLSRLSDASVGMIGESINSKWDMDWNSISRSMLNYNVGMDNFGNKVTRVEFYLYMIKKWGVEPGLTGRHLRALIWALRGEVLSKIKNFPVGAWKEECIAAEIAVSKSIEQLGLRVEQVDADPFKYIQHSEWRSDGYSKL